MDTKFVIKTFFALLLFAAIFLAGFYVSAANQFIKAVGNPRIESETEARYRFMESNMPLPENATRIYYASRGFVDAEHYAAFSLSSTKECEEFIEEKLDVKLEDFKEISELPDDFVEYGPSTWEREYRDPVWDLKKADKYLLCTNGYLRAILYAPEKHRFYFRLR